MKKNIFKKIAFLILKIIAVALPLFLIFRQIDISKVGPSISLVQWWTIPVLLTLGLIMMFLQGFRWWLLIRAFTKKLSLLRSLAYHFSSSFYSLVLPNSLSQEIIRTVFATKQAGSIISWSSTWIAKIIGILISLGFSMFGLLVIAKDLLPTSVRYILLGCFLALVLATFISFSKRSSRFLRPIIIPIIPSKFIAWLEKLREGIYQYRNKKKWLLAVLLSTVLMQFVFVLCVALVIYGITGSFYLIECMAFMPLIEMISMAQPITPNGIGVREALVAIMFKQIGLTHEQLGIYIIVSNLGILLKLLGIIPVLMGFNNKQQK